MLQFKFKRRQDTYAGPMVAVLGVVFISLCPKALRADVVTINPNHDTTLFAGAVNNSGGANPLLFAGTNTALADHHGLLSFDVKDNIPTGATITGVQLTMTLGQIAGGGMGGGSGTFNIDLHRVLDSWGEGSVSTGGGNGAAAGAGDATWNARIFSSSSPTLWTTAGGDFSSTVSATTAVGTALTTYTWSGAGLVSDVQDWLNNQDSDNFGWMIVNEDTTDAQTFRAFDSRETAAPPVLSISFTAVPEPASIVLFGMAAVVVVMGAACRRARYMPQIN